MSFFRNEHGGPAPLPDLHLRLKSSAVMSTSLSKSEFASALGMKADAMFVKKMFRIVDKDGDGRISFLEFLETVMLFSCGRPDDKLRIFFDMCDQDNDGLINKDELSEMLRSLVEIVRTTSVSDDHVTELIDGMFQVSVASSLFLSIPVLFTDSMVLLRWSAQDAGLQRKEYLTYGDFKLIMKEYKGDFGTIGLDCKGAKHAFFYRPSSSSVPSPAGFKLQQCRPKESSYWPLEQWNALTTFLEENRQNIFYLFIFYVATIALFVERFICE